MNRVNSEIINLAITRDKPLLGICYGAEMLALVAGGTIRRMASPAKGVAEVNTIRDNPLCSGRIAVYESHAYRDSPDAASVGGRGQLRRMRKRGHKVRRFAHIRNAVPTRR